MERNRKAAGCCDGIGSDKNGQADDFTSLGHLITLFSYS